MSTTDGPGGGGSPHADKLSLEQMIAIAKADKGNNERTREQAEGAKLAEEVLADMHKVLSEKTKELKKNFSSPADGALYTSLDEAIPNLKDASSSAGELKTGLESAADAVDRNYDKMTAYEKEQGSLDSTDPKDLKSFADPGTGKDGYSVLRDDIEADAREDFRTEDDNYLSHSMEIGNGQPSEYAGPKWEGREPTYSMDDTLDDYYPEDSPYSRGGASHGGAGGPGGTYSASGGESTSGSRPDIDSRPDGPELQNPGGTPAPGTTAPSTAVPGGTTAPTGGGGMTPGTFVPGGSTGGPNFSGKPVAPPAQRPPSTMPNARPTPGMSRPVSTPGGMRSGSSNATGRPTGPVSGRGTSGAPKNSLLPNQRQAAAGRNPVTGSGRVPQANGGAAQPRTGSQGAPKTGRGGVARAKPNAGFEESMYRNTRAGRTVPGVIGSRSAGTGAPVANGRGAGGSATPRVSSAGKVIGERKNKGSKVSGPKLQAGSLTDTTKNAKKDTRHQWQRAKPKQSTEPLSGSVAIDRNRGEKPQGPENVAATARAKRRQARRRLWAGQKESAPIPASELFDGTEGKVTRSVIHGAKPPKPMDPSDVGPRFSTYGYES